MQNFGGNDGVNVGPLDSERNGLSKLTTTFVQIIDLIIDLLFSQKQNG